MFKIIKRLINWTDEYKGRLYLGFIYSFINSLFTAFPIMISSYILGLVLEDYKGGDKFPTDIIPYTIVVLIITIFGKFIFSYLRAITQDSIAYEKTAKERTSLGNTFKRVSLGFFEKNNTGELTSAVTTDLSFMEMFAMKMVDIVVNGYINAIVMILCLLWFSIPVALVAGTGVLLSALFLFLLEKRSKKNAPYHQKAQDDMIESSIEYIKGLQVIKAFKQEGISINRVRKSYKDSKNINIKIEAEYIPFNCLHLFALKAASVGVVFVSCVQTLNGVMTLPVMLMISIFSFIIFNGIEIVNSAAHVLEIIDVTLDKLDRINKAKTIDESGKDIILKKFNIDFKNVSFSYGEKENIKNVTFNIPENSTTAIVGPSGSGKTTICNLIARFYDINSGSIKIGDVDIRNIKCDSLLSNISMVFQKVYLFNDSILNNIKFGNPSASIEEVIEAAKKACCHDFIMLLPNGYDTIIGEGGSTLSGGEKQRISIARAILKDSPIIILDEATASVDPENEHLIQKAIGELINGKTIITIAHRLATIENADQILVIDNGRLVQQGTHKELIGNKGIYKEFIDIRKNSEGWSII